MAKFCSNCGTKLSDDAKFCGKCGVAADNDTINATRVRSTFGKSKIVAGILGILLGSFGVHNFYLGYNSKGTTQILITVLSCGILSWVSYIWGLIEGIQILTGSIDTDADGNKLVD